MRRSTEASTSEVNEEPYRPLPMPFVVVLGAVIALLAIVVRVELVDFQSRDFKNFLMPWWNFITSHGGYRSLRHDFADYNVPYLYILVGLFYLAPHHPLAAIKAVSVGFDVALAVLTYLLVAFRRPGYRLPAVAALTVLLLPTVIMNGSIWAQCDSIFTAFALAGLYFLVRRRPWLACTLFGVAYAFKQQALFLFPVLLVVALRRELPWRALLAIPAVFLLLDVPALIIGRPIGELLGIYSSQADGYQQLTLNAPSVYQLLPANVESNEIRSAGILFAGAVVLLIVAALAATRQRLTPQRLILAATLFAVAVPFLLPSMHERYFYVGDVLSVVVAFQSPRRLWFVPLLIQYASATSYVPFLFGGQPGPLQIAALVMLAVVIVLAVQLAQELYPAKPADASAQPGLLAPPSATSDLSTQRTPDPKVEELPA
ncbi:hypothetical protein ABT297_39090 [Dactylosporangium sp. NPDC000555]|uniref:hypothetical protein n=1 Tax=Dactylosporangium sp. NPDC000555 TaxID=3154260 RepID=UPI00331ACEE8